MPVEDSGGLAETREVSKPWLGDDWLLLVFMLAMLLLLTRGEFWQPDGEIEARVCTSKCQWLSCASRIRRVSWRGPRRCGRSE